jgi:hypothetical protein
MATTTNFGWETPDDTDLVKDGAAAMRTLGNSIDTSFVDLKGGTTNQVLAKNSNTDLDFKWVAQDDSDAIQNAIVDAKGDLISATAADTPARLAVGTNGQVLTADSTASTGLKWATPASGGKLLQVVSVSTATSTTLTSASYVDVTNLTATITPTASTSKIFVMVNMPLGMFRNAALMYVNAKLVRGSTDIYRPGNGYSGFPSGIYGQALAGVELDHPMSFMYMDSPATTSATTYKIQAELGYTANSATAVCGGGTNGSTITLFEIGA